jgi:hypothetical protein
MKAIRSLFLAAVIAALVAAPAEAASGPSITGGGMTTGDMGPAMFGLAVNNGQGHFECLMASMMTVEATVTKVDSASSGAASFEGTAAVTLSVNNPFGLPSGPMARGVPFTASVTSGGPGIGTVDLKIAGMNFPGTVAHGRISIAP